MRTIKTILLLFFAVHFIVIAIIGFTRFSDMATDDNDPLINKFGHAVIKKSQDLKEVTAPLTDAVFAYALFAGTNRGYSFFSPNVSTKKLEISFESEGKSIEIPFRSPESTLKFYGANLYFNSNLDRIKERDTFLKSIAMSFFNNNQDMQHIDVVLNLSNYMDIKTTQDEGFCIERKSMIGFTAKKDQYASSF